MLDRLQELRDCHGDAGYVAFLDQLVATLTEESAGSVEPTEAELRQKEAERAKQERHQRAREELRFCHVCDDCGRLRTGTRWIEAPPPDGFFVWKDRSPFCD